MLASVELYFFMQILLIVVHSVGHRVKFVVTNVSYKFQFDFYMYEVSEFL